MSLASLVRLAGYALAGLLVSGSAALAVEAAATAAVNVRTGPGTGFGVVDTLHAGEVVDVVECNSSNTWCRIEHDGPDGWVSRSYLGAPPASGSSSSDLEFGMTIPLPGGGYFSFGTPGYTPPGPPPPAPGVARVCVYDLPGYGGTSVCRYPGQRDANLSGFWNNRVSSLRTYGGASIRLCQNANYGGVCTVFNSNRSALGAAMNNRASSYDVLPPEPRRVCVYDLANYQGASVCVNAGASSASLGPVWNNKITSVKVFGGARILLCQNPGFGGFCRTVNSNEAALGPLLDNRVSSYRTW
ncbi:MAG TPA: SH3 domain-containing protein [Devosiaceae bacterium]